MTNAKETKSPIKNLPVRMPGQSIREQIDKVLDDTVLPYAFAAMVSIFAAWQEWAHYWFKLPRNPWIYTAIAAIVTLVAVRKLTIAWRVLKALGLGKLGEEAVGQFLDEELRPMSYQVLHDIPGNGFNVDHVVIGPTGVFAIETKTRSKPAKGETVVTYDGDKIRVNGSVPDRDPILQAKATAKWIAELIDQKTGKRVPVQPIVVYPGWYVKMPPNSAVWVLHEKGVPTFIANARGELPTADVLLITRQLKEYVIQKGKEKK